MLLNIQFMLQKKHWAENLVNHSQMVSEETPNFYFIIKNRIEYF